MKPQEYFKKDDSEDDWYSTSSLRTHILGRHFYLYTARILKDETVWKLVVVSRFYQSFNLWLTQDQGRGRGGGEGIWLELWNGNI